MNKFCFAAVLAVLTLSFVSCQSTRSTTHTTLFHSTMGRQLTAAQCVADANWLFDFIDNHHPNPYWRTSKHEFYVMRTNDIRLIRENAPMDWFELYMILSPAVEKIYDDHCSLMGSIYYHRPQSLPSSTVTFERCENAFYPVRTGRQYASILGKKVVALDGIPVAQIVSNISAITGSVFGRPEELAERKITPAFDYVNISTFLYVLYGIRGLQPLTLTVEDGGSNFNYTIKPFDLSTNMSYAVYRPAYLSRGLVSMPSNADYYFTILSNDIGYMRIATFRITPDAASNLNYFDFVKNAFRTLKQKHIPYLVIDITGNPGGGDDAWADLMAYVYHKPFKYNESYQNPSTLDEVKQDMISEGCINAGYDPEWDKYGYNGKVYLLSFDDYSAAANCAVVMQYYRAATVVGAPLSALGLLFGNAEITNLPNSGIGLYYPTAPFSALGWNGAPRDFVPDVEVNYYNYTNINDYWSPDRETVYSKALALIRADEAR